MQLPALFDLSILFMCKIFSHFTKTVSAATAVIHMYGLSIAIVKHNKLWRIQSINQARRQKKMTFNLKFIPGALILITRTKALMIKNPVILFILFSLKVIKTKTIYLN